jgi:hypothetical protein
MQIMKPSTIQIVSKIKTIHSLLSQQREFANAGQHINTDDLRNIKNISKALDFIHICEDIRLIQTAKLGEE